MPNRNDFYQADSFDEIVNLRKTLVTLDDGLWYPVFQTSFTAQRFANYVAGYCRRVAPGAKTNVGVIYSQNRGGYVAELTVEFPLWGQEKGLVLCHRRDAAGLAVETKSSKTGWVLLPVKFYSWTIRTKSGTLYVLFNDGTGFCRSQDDGALEAADALLFATSESEAAHAHAHGGAVTTVAVPREGLVPIYISGAVTRDAQKRVVLRKGSFRVGTRVKVATEAKVTP